MIPSDESSQSTGRNAESLFMDLTYFDELERKVKKVLDRLRQLRTENEALVDRLAEMETALKHLRMENEELKTRQQEFESAPANRERDQLLRRKVQDLLGKLDRLAVR
jgi:FtsZ-binding cell division protein ZapB